jgi:hypothetical protein
MRHSCFPLAITPDGTRNRRFCMDVPRRLSLVIVLILQACEYLAFHRMFAYNERE